MMIRQLLTDLKKRSVWMLAALVVTVIAAPTAYADLIPDFPEARLESERQIRSPSHRVMLSPIREVRNEIRSESIARVAVEGRGRLLQINADASRSEARSWYQGQLNGLSAEVLFDCSGRECGRSNVWANQIFNQATLYGRDQDQDYLAAGLVDDQGQAWLVLVYTVTRGNQRQYVWVEELKLGEGAVVPGFSYAEGRVRGPVVVPWSGTVSHRFDWDATARRNLQGWASGSGTRVVVASFSELGEGETLQQAMDRAEAAAGSMSSLLDRSGIPQSRQLIQVLGPTVRVSAPGRQGDRIELLVIRDPE